MRYKELLERLQKYTNVKITQVEIAEGLKLSQSAIAKRIVRNSEFSKADFIEIKTYIEDKYGSSFVVKKAEETVTLDFYPEVFGSCGGGAFVLSEEKEQINVPVKCFNFPFSKVKQYSVINAVGDSMQPFIYDKDKLIVEHYSGEQIKDNRVYVFCYCNEIFIKRLSKNINEIIIKSDNPDPIYRARIIEKEDMNNIIIIGEIVGLMRDLR